MVGETRKKSSMQGDTYRARLKDGLQGVFFSEICHP